MRSRRSWGIWGAAAAGVIAGACASLQWQPLGPRRTAAIAGAQPVGSEECLVCHDEVQGHEKIATYHAGCESCHGGGSLHADSEEPHDIRYPANADCLGCHAAGYDSHLQWGTGEHSRAGVLCSDCHNPHAITRRHLRERAQVGFPRMDDRSRLCIECHREVAAQLTYSSHHPVAEGAMACTNCHDPHEDGRLRPGDRNQLCADCHQDYMGPWIFEHPPVVEGCTSCHAPHGAVGDDLLATTQPAICISCHSMNDLWHHQSLGTGIFTNRPISQDRPVDPAEQIQRNEAYTFLRRCTDCHGAVHGSYTDEHLRH